jgi:hypothetical protein
MSWLFSRALVEAFSGGGCSDGAPSAPSSGNPTPQAYLPPDRMTAFSRPSRFGMTFAPLTDDHGAAVLTSFLAAFPARTSASQAKAPALTEPDQACGPTWRASLARFSPATSSWKTAQRSLLADSDESSVTWPRSGMTADGQCWELPTLERRISGTGSGLWLQTPIAAMARDAVRSPAFAKGRAPSPQEFVKQWPTPTTSDGGANHSTDAVTKRGHGINLLGAVHMWPTPMAADSRGSSGRPALGKQVQLVDAVKWPTPTVCGNYNRKGASTTSGDGLATAVLKCATPTASPWRSGKASQATMERNSRPLSEQIGGSLNPTWVEWLMGFPLGWTDLKPLATDKSHSAQQPHGGF